MKHGFSKRARSVPKLPGARSLDALAQSVVPGMGAGGAPNNTGHKSPTSYLSAK
jgi:hypothetical protein